MKAVAYAPLVITAWKELRTSNCIRAQEDTSVLLKQECHVNAQKAPIMTSSTEDSSPTASCVRWVGSARLPRKTKEKLARKVTSAPLGLTPSNGRARLGPTAAIALV